MPILTKPMKKYLLSSDKRGYREDLQSAYNNRIIDYATRGLKDLALLAEKLPEKQQAQIFNEETLTSLARSIFSFRTKQGINEKETQERGTRVLQLCYDILNEMGTLENASDLAPDIMNILTMGGLHETLPTITALKAIYLKGMSQHQ